MRILITGGSGRLGRGVVDLLGDYGHDVVSADLVPPARHREIWVQADLSDPGDARASLARVRPDAVVHLAAIAVPFSRPEVEILRTNTALAFNVAQAAVDLGVGSVVIASSPTVTGYGSPTGWVPRYLPLDEDHPCEPWNAYALSKLVAERTMRMFAAQAGDRIRLAAFRPCYVITLEEWDGAPTQAGHTVLERLDEPALGAASMFNYVDVRDAAAFVHVLLEKLPELPNGEVFYVGAGDALAREPLDELLPRFHAGTAPYASALTGSAPAFSTAKAERLLGWKAERSWRTELVTPTSQP